MKFFCVSLAFCLVSASSQSSDKMYTYEIGIDYPQLQYFESESITLITVPNTTSGVLRFSWFPHEKVSITPKVLFNSIIGDEDTVYSTLSCSVNIFFLDYTTTGAYAPFSISVFGNSENKPKHSGSISFGIGHQWLLKSSFVFHVEGIVQLFPDFSKSDSYSTLAVLDSGGISITSGLGYRFQLPH